MTRSWVAHASRVLVSASRRNSLCFAFRGQLAWRNQRESSRSPGGDRQHARGVRSPDARYTAS